jgi:hypothetical protein
MKTACARVLAILERGVARSAVTRLGDRLREQPGVA